MSKKNTKIALAALCVLGAACYLLQFVLGEDITHMNNFVPWGLYIVGFMCFTGLAAGALLLIGLAWLTDGLAELRPYTRILLICGVLCGLAGAGAFIFVDLGNPQRGIYMMLSPNPTSPQVWDAAVLSLYGLTGILLGRQAWLIAQGRRTAASMRPLALLAVIAGLLVIVTSFAFALMLAAPSWNEPGEPLSFLFAAAIIALAVLSLVLLHLGRVGYAPVPERSLRCMIRVTAVLLILELLYAISDVCIALYAPHGEAAQVVFWQLAGAGAVPYWLEIMLLVVSIWLLVRGKQPRQWQAGAMTSLLAVLFVKYNLLVAAQLHPLLGYAGPSAYNPPALGLYVPALVEWGTFLGILAAASLLGIEALERGRAWLWARDEN